MSKVKSKDQPSVEELLASIREAIYEKGEGGTGTAMAAAKQSAAREHGGAGQGMGGNASYNPAAAALQAPPPGRDPIASGTGSERPHGSMRGIRVALGHDTGGTGRVSTRTDDFLNLRQRLTTLVEEGKSLPARNTASTSSSQGFSGILGGDVRLEEALARLSRAGRAPMDEEIARPPLAPEATTARRRLDAAAIEDLAGRELRPAIRDAIESELRELPSRAYEPHGRPAAEAAPDYDTGDYAPEAESTYDGEAAYQDAPPEAWDDTAVTPEEAHVEPLARYAPEPHHDYRREPPPPRHEAPPPRHEPPLQDYAPPMLAPESAEQASSAFERLADTIMAQATGGERSIEDITRELLRPMLKSWLDHNLPKLVERLVREEIERVARRGNR